MVIFNCEGAPILTCPCGSQWWVTGTNKCCQRGREATQGEVEEYWDCVEDYNKKALQR